MKTYSVYNRKTGERLWWCKNGFDDTPHVDFDLEQARRMFGLKAAYRIEEITDGVVTNPDVDPPAEEEIVKNDRMDEVIYRLEKEADEKGLGVLEKMSYLTRGILEERHRQEYLKLANQK